MIATDNANLNNMAGDGEDSEFWHDRLDVLLGKRLARTDRFGLL
jgi:hypothetical protein